MKHFGHDDSCVFTQTRIIKPAVLVHSLDRMNEHIMRAL